MDQQINSQPTNQVAQLTQESSNDILRALKLFMSDGNIIELRCPETKRGTKSGYFNNLNTAVKWATLLNGNVPFVYVTINPVNPELLARAANRIKDYSKYTTGDNDIVRRRFFLIDLDANRPAGISSTNEEHEAALTKALLIRDFLREEGWPEPGLFDSSNGAHLLFAIDLPNDEESKKLIERCLKALNALFSDDETKKPRVLIDQKVFNAARIVKLYGTWSKKGDSTKERPHRLSKILDLPEKLEIIPVEKLKSLATMYAEPKRQQQREHNNGYHNNDFDLETWINEHNLNVYKTKSWNNATLYILDQCPFNAAHGRDSRIIKFDNGGIGFGCFHDGCSNNDWYALRDLLEPEWRNRKENKYQYLEPNINIKSQNNGTQTNIFYLTDTGNGERLAYLFGNDIRYCFKWRKWLIWNGKQWGIDDGDKIQTLAKHTARQIYKEASNTTDDDRREKIVEWGLKSESSQRIKAMIERARSEPGIPIKTESLDSNKWLLNVLNGTIDLKTGELKPHQRTDYMTKIAPVEYDPNAVCPIWLNFLYEIMNGNQILVDFLQKAIGYSATGDTSEQIIFFLYGVGANGKSTFLNVISDIFGDYAMNAPTDMLMKKKNGGISNDIARLRGTRFISAVESEEGRQLAEVLIKQLTGEDKIAARFLFQEYFEFKPEGKIFLATNAKPVIKGDDYGIWRRVRLVPFEVIFTPEKQDKKLPEKLKAEYPGIFKWIIDGCLEWQKSGLGIPEKVLAATEEYRREMDSVANFIEEHCNTSIKNAKAASGELYNLYTAWCYANDEEPLTQKKVAKRLEKMGFVKERGTGGRYYWHGLGILTSVKGGRSEPFEPFEGKVANLSRDIGINAKYTDHGSNHSKGSPEQEISSVYDDDGKWD